MKKLASKKNVSAEDGELATDADATAESVVETVDEGPSGPEAEESAPEASSVERPKAVCVAASLH